MSVGQVVSDVWEVLASNFNAIAGWASIAGLVVTTITFLRVQTLDAALRDRALRRIRGGLFDHVSGNPVGKQRLTK